MAAASGRISAQEVKLLLVFRQQHDLPRTRTFPGTAARTPAVD
jgi:hypothetical protein